MSSPTAWRPGARRAALCPLSVLLSVLLAGACAGVDPATRGAHAATLAAARDWRRVDLDAGRYTLAAWLPVQASSADGRLTIYIEGDGMAWTSESRPSDDPTPLTPLALQLALAQPGGAAAWLARPCQYTGGVGARGCTQDDWTGRRFAPAIIDTTNRAVDQLMARVQARRLVLVGYSGGGAVAALVAARRKDVVALVTVAGNLDHRAWTALHKVTPLDGSDNPADAWRALSTIPQVHWIGADDRNVPATVAESYAARFPAGQKPLLRVVPGFDHACCWARDWPALWTRSLEQAGASQP